MERAPLALTGSPEAREALRRINALHDAVTNVVRQWQQRWQRHGALLGGLAHVLGKIFVFNVRDLGKVHRLWRTLSIAELQLADEAVQLPNGGFDQLQCSVRCDSWRNCVADFREMYFYNVLLNTRMSKARFIGSPTNVDLLHCLTNYSIWWPNLDKIYFERCDTLADDAVGHLMNCRELQSVSLVHCGTTLTDTAAEYLSRCPQLRIVSFRGCVAIRDDAVAHLAGCLQLEQVCFAECDLLTDHASSYMREYPKLRHVDLSFCRGLTNRTASALAGCHQLESLNLNFLPLLTDAAAYALTECKQLETLHVVGCENLTADFARILRGQRPQLKLHLQDPNLVRAAPQIRANAHLRDADRECEIMIIQQFTVR